jgi:hypothetical protein
MRRFLTYLTLSSRPNMPKRSVGQASGGTLRFLVATRTLLQQAKPARRGSYSLTTNDKLERGSSIPFRRCVRTADLENESGERIDPSREAAQECSPGRKPWVKKWHMTEPRRGEREVFTHSLKSEVTAATTPILDVGSKVQITTTLSSRAQPRDLASRWTLALTNAATTPSGTFPSRHIRFLPPWRNAIIAAGPSLPQLCFAEPWL